jgi:DNA-binding MarR family transcriptional regulator
LKLEEEIKQTAFKSPYQKLAVNLIYTSGWLNGKYANFLKEAGLTIQQFNVLRILRGQHPEYCSLKLIRERMLDRMSDASRIVDKLVAKGFMSRKQCPKDRRSVNLMISEKGLKTLKQLDAIDAQIEKVFGNLTTQEVKTLNHLLDQLRDSD